MNDEELRAKAEAATYHGGLEQELADAVLGLLDRLEHKAPTANVIRSDLRLPVKFLSEFTDEELDDLGGLPDDEAAARRAFQLRDWDTVRRLQDETAPTDDEREAWLQVIAEAIDDSCAGGGAGLDAAELERVSAHVTDVLLPRLVRRGEAESDGPLNVERENAAAEYTRRNVGGIQPVMTVGSRVHDAFVSGAEWAAGFRRAPAEPAVTDVVVERAARAWASGSAAPNNWENMAPRLQGITKDRMRAALEAALSTGRGD